MWLRKTHQKKVINDFALEQWGSDMENKREILMNRLHGIMCVKL